MLAILGSAKWKRDTAHEIERLSSGNGASHAGTSRYDRAAIDALPRPVLRYFDFALTQGQPVVASACIEWEGTFSMRPRRWSAFTATQHYRVQPPGFVWDARIWMTGVLPVLVRDSYADHAGSLKAAIGGIVKVADARGTADIAKGELLRYLGEAVWFPDGTPADCWRYLDCARRRLRHGDLVGRRHDRFDGRSLRRIGRDRVDLGDASARRARDIRCSRRGSRTYTATRAVTA